MGTPSTLSRDELFHKYWTLNQSAQTIADQHRASPKTIWCLMRKWNIPTKLKRPLAIMTREELNRLYTDEGLTTYQIAARFSVDPSSVWSKLHLLQIPLRKSGGCKRGTRGVGKHKTTQGYVRCLIPDNSPYIIMARPDGYVLEHRLVMAQHLGRPLLKYEQVHHKGMKYPQGSREDKADNRIENLELMPSPGAHTKMSACSHCELKKEIRLLHWQIKEQTEQIRNLTAKVMGVES